MGKRLDLVGEVFGLLTVVAEAEGYTSPAGQTARRWLCSCECGGEASVRTGGLRNGTTRSCGCQKYAHIGASQARGIRHPGWCGDEITYKGAHRRVYRARGKASSHDCIDCGATALHWSYRRGSEREVVGHNGSTGLSPYSPDPNDYDPRCSRCHLIYDEHPGGRREPVVHQEAS